MVSRMESAAQAWAGSPSRLSPATPIAEFFKNNLLFMVVLGL
jgi:hypothetical protein